MVIWCRFSQRQNPGLPPLNLVFSLNCIATFVNVIYSLPFTKVNASGALRRKINETIHCYSRTLKPTNHLITPLKHAGKKNNTYKDIITNKHCMLVLFSVHRKSKWLYLAEAEQEGYMVTKS